MRNHVRIKGSKYKYVSAYRNTKTQEIVYEAALTNLSKVYNLEPTVNLYSNVEKEAALIVDKYLISQNKEPFNILKRK